MISTAPHADLHAVDRVPARSTVRSCEICGCTDLDCSDCIARIGTPCAWIGPTIDICTACAPTAALLATTDQVAAVLNNLTDFIDRHELRAATSTSHNSARR